MPVLNFLDPADSTYKPLSAGQAIIPAGDFNACTTTGLYQIAGNATNGAVRMQAYSSSTVGILQVLAIDSTHLQQIFYGGANNASIEVFHRSCNAGTWTVWESIQGRQVTLGDFNNATGSGLYSLAGTATNGPGVAGQGMLVMYGSQSGATNVNGSQTWTSYTTGEIWERHYVSSGAWSAWRKTFPYNMDAFTSVLLYAERTTNAGPTITEGSIITTSAVTIPTGHKIRVEAYVRGCVFSSGATAAFLRIRDGTTSAGTELVQCQHVVSSQLVSNGGIFGRTITGLTGSHQFFFSIEGQGANASSQASTTWPSWIQITDLGV